MTLPVSGDMSVAMIEAEIGLANGTQLGFGDAQARQLASVPAGDISASDFYGKSAGVPVPTAYYGLSTEGYITEAGLLALTQVPNIALPYQFQLTAGANQFMYWASPTDVGFVRFYDRDSLFTGGWDGAFNNGVNYGPRTLTLNGIQCYVYRTDFPNLGFARWEAQFDANPPY